MQMLLEEEDVLPTRINVMMPKLKTLLHSAKLLNLSQFHTKTFIAMRWSSTLDMEMHYQQTGVSAQAGVG